ncbi:MAG: MFS transporter [Ruminococcaceae bacterium]|nr:MFS transporter [Oscillospiraceae bacterium]
MKEKVLTPEKLEKKQAKIQKEIARLEKEKAKPRRSGYLAYLILIICVVYITDEIASQIQALMKTEIATDLLAKYGESSIGVLDILGIIAFPFQGISLLYKPLSDKYGRKTFLVINTFGMGVALFLIYLSGNLVFYIIGSTLAAFFVPHDMQVVYITESAPPRHRAKIYSLVKGVATFGIMLVPLFRRMFMTSASEWRMVYLVPAIMGVAASLIALFSLRETDAFIESRLKYLNMTDEEKDNAKKSKDLSESQGGLVAAMKFVAGHKQLKWLYAAIAFGTMGVLVTMQYQTIISYGYAQSYLVQGLYSTIESALDAASVGAVTSALFAFPIGSGLVQLSHGFVSDKWGRKAAIISMAAATVISLVIFSAGAENAWNPYLVGLFSGVCVGSFWACTDINTMMVGESSPTNLRSSIVSLQMFALGIGYVVTYCVGIPLITYLGNSSIPAVSLGLAVPSLIVFLLILIFKTKETKGVNLESVTGEEYD